jgi:peptidyl-prolyl cis-trans isomerase B (cyclophilin B)
VSPNARDRAREKRRYEKRQTSLGLRRAEARRNRQVLAIVLAMLLVIGGFVGVTLALKKDDTKTTAATSQPSASATSARTLPDKATAAGKTFTATVPTSRGVITMELDGTKAPQAVASFLSLARSGYWANSPCHRLTTEGIFVLQCGDPTGTGNGDPGYGFEVENPPADSTYGPGTLAMARTPDAKKGNGGQFFIVYKETKLVDPAGYSIFGKVTSGMGIVDKVAAAGVDQSKAPAPKQPISILKVDVAEKKA